MQQKQIYDKIMPILVDMPLRVMGLLWLLLSTVVATVVVTMIALKPEPTATIGVEAGHNLLFSELASRPR